MLPFSRLISKRIVFTFSCLLFSSFLCSCGIKKADNKLKFPAFITVLRSDNINNSGTSTLESKLNSSYHKFIKELTRDTHSGNIFTSVYTINDTYFVNSLSKMSRSGLMPDGIITDIYNTRNLYSKSLIDEQSSDLLGEYIPPHLESLLIVDNKIIGIPFARASLLACYNTKKIYSALYGINDLASYSKDVDFAFRANIHHFFWTMQYFDADIALSRLLSGSDISGNAYKPLFSWLDWLKKSVDDGDIVVVRNSVDLLSMLINDDVDWVPCWSHNIPELREKMGLDLGVAFLPLQANKVDHINYKYEIFSFGRDSSSSQLSASMLIAHALAGPWQQRKLASSLPGIFPLKSSAQPSELSNLGFDKNLLDDIQTPSTEENIDQSMLDIMTSLDYQNRYLFESILLEYVYGVINSDEFIEALKQMIPDQGS